jgi:hypothetical protein
MFTGATLAQKHGVTVESVQGFSLFLECVTYMYVGWCPELLSTRLPPLLSLSLSLSLAHSLSLCMPRCIERAKSTVKGVIATTTCAHIRNEHIIVKYLFFFAGQGGKPGAGA